MPRLTVALHANQKGVYLTLEDMDRAGAVVNDGRIGVTAGRGVESIVILDEVHQVRSCVLNDKKKEEDSVTSHQKARHKRRQKHTRLDSNVEPKQRLKR